MNGWWTRGRILGFALASCAVWAAACAVVEPPPGGPVDITPPHLVSVTPDSGVTGLGETRTLRIRFSEKMDRTSANTWLHFFPDQRVRKTKWHGATEAEVQLEAPLPADTVIVVEISSGMKDAHKVTNPVSRRFPIATGNSIPGGSIRGVLIMGDSAVTRGVVELYDVPPDTIEYFRQPLLRRTVTDENGSYLFDWLPVPGGPWLMRAFVDTDDNLRPGERDPQRLIPDTLTLDTATPRVAAGVTTLFGLNEPGRLVTGAFTPLGHPGATLAWTMAITEEDSGWVPAPPRTGTVYSALDPDAGGTVSEVAPGLNRLVLFSDVDGDSAFSAIPDSNVAVGIAAEDTAWTGWVFEPWILVEGLRVEPGLPADFVVPDTTATIVMAPVPALPDSSAMTDSTSLDIPTDDDTPPEAQEAEDE